MFRQYCSVNWGSDFWENPSNDRRRVDAGWYQHNREYFKLLEGKMFRRYPKEWNKAWQNLWRLVIGRYEGMGLAKGYFDFRMTPTMFYVRSLWQMFPNIALFQPFKYSFHSIISVGVTWSICTNRSLKAKGELKHFEIVAYSLVHKSMFIMS